MPVIMARKGRQVEYVLNPHAGQLRLYILVITPSHGVESQREPTR